MDAISTLDTGLGRITMNISYVPIPIGNLPPAIEKVGHEFIRAAAFLLIPTELLYFSIYFHTKGAYKVYKILTFLSIAAFWISPSIAPIGCGPVRCLQNFASMSTITKSSSLYVLTFISCNWNNESVRYVGTQTFYSNLHSRKETARLAFRLDRTY